MNKNKNTVTTSTYNLGGGVSASGFGFGAGYTRMSPVTTVESQQATPSARPRRFSSHLDELAYEITSDPATMRRPLSSREAMIPTVARRRYSPLYCILFGLSVPVVGVFSVLAAGMLLLTGISGHEFIASGIAIFVVVQLIVAHLMFTAPMPDLRTDEEKQADAERYARNAARARRERVGMDAEAQKRRESERLSPMYSYMPYNIYNDD